MRKIIFGFVEHKQSDAVSTVNRNGLLMIPSLTPGAPWRYWYRTSTTHCKWARQPKLLPLELWLHLNCRCKNAHLLYWSSHVAALERKLLSCICEDGERRSFSSVLTSRRPPGVPEASGSVRERPYRTDTPTSTGDLRRVQMVVRRRNWSLLSCWPLTRCYKSLMFHRLYRVNVEVYMLLQLL